MKNTMNETMKMNTVNETMKMNTVKETMKYTDRTRLSEHFKLREMLRSGTAITYGIENVPTLREIENLKALCTAVLEPLRQRFGRIIITSGFRCNELNELVGGARNSQHLLGEAADIHVSNPTIAKKYAQFITDNTDFDQLIFEPIRQGRNPRPRWLHVSYSRRHANRHQVL